ncbi:MAG: hypothetical protein ACOH5I_07095 [Oligoflexus sp.]
MNGSKTTLSLSFLTIIAVLAYACQPQTPVRERRIISPNQQGAQAGEQGENNGDATQDDEGEDEEDEAGGTPPESYSMSWDMSADPGIISYKVYIVPPDKNARFPGKTDVPVEVVSYSIDELQQDGQKYSVSVDSDLIKAALGTAVVDPAAYCFTITAVNGVGNSSHSPVICP